MKALLAYSILMVYLAVFGATALAQDSLATQQLKARSHELREDIIKITDDIYTSVGHSVSTVSMIEGDEALIIVDTGFAPEHAKKIMAEFRKISDKPVGAIILTHSHADHVRGASVFLAEGEDIQIWGRSNYNSENSRLKAVLRAGNIRGARQGGFKLPPPLARIIGPARCNIRSLLRSMDTWKTGSVPICPTRSCSPWKSSRGESDVEGKYRILNLPQKNWLHTSRPVWTMAGPSP